MIIILLKKVKIPIFSDVNIIKFIVIINETFILNTPCEILLETSGVR